MEQQPVNPVNDAMQPPATAAAAADILMQSAMKYLGEFHPLQLVAFGMAYAAILFILLPRISHGISSAILLLSVVNQIHTYQKFHQGAAPLEHQIQSIAVIVVTTLMQLYCMGKTFTVI